MSTRMTLMFVCLMWSGGETIRDICRQSGAHVELNREQSTNSLERVFRISGLPEQMQHAVRLISDKAGIVSSCLVHCEPCINML